jgi:hypothetical protein
VQFLVRKEISMAKHPDWSIKDPSWSKTDYWTAQPTNDDIGRGYWTHTESSNPNIVGNSGVRSYTKTPGFLSPMRKAMIKPLAYSANYYEARADREQREVEMRLYAYSPPGGGPAVQVPYVFQNSTTISHNSFALGFRKGSYDASSVDRRATDKLLENLKDQKFNAPQAFAEREQTMKTVTGAAKTVASALTNLRKGNFAGAAKAFGIKPPKRGQRRFNRDFANDSANAIGDGWLALQYGWKPLLQDVYGASETLAQASLGPENKNSVYSVTSGQSRKSLELSQRVVNDNSGYTGYDSTLYTCKGFYLVRYGVRYVRSSPPVSSLAKLGILNPAQLAWELVPYSFVVDWFFPIGNWLGGLDASAGLTFESGYRTTLLKTDATSTRTRSITKNGSLASSFTIWDSEMEKETRMDRSTLGSFPSAPAPRFKNPLSYSHLASAMALLKQFKR